MKQVNEEDHDAGSGSGLVISGLIVILFSSMIVIDPILIGLLLIMSGLLYWLKALYGLTKIHRMGCEGE